MTPKEKAKELKDKFWEIEPLSNFDGDKGFYSKQCALIAVDEILDFMILTLKWTENSNGNVDYWQEVKQEIEKL